MYLLSFVQTNSMAGGLSKSMPGILKIDAPIFHARVK
jgi:hypothetical protein